MSKLIVIRGNSGSGKTTIAKELQRLFGRNTMLISQDVIRREIIWVKDNIGTEAVALLIELVKYGKQKSKVVILEGILNSEIYKPLFLSAIEEFKTNIYAYYYNLPFEETLKRHNTKKNKDEFGEKEMREWWIEKDFIKIINEKVITKELEVSEVIKMGLVPNVGRRRSILNFPA